MKKIKELLLLLPSFFLLGCTPSNDAESQKILNQVGYHFSSSEDPVLLSEITDFSWDKVCVFYADDSSSGSTKSWVEGKADSAPSISKNAPLAMIFYQLDTIQKIAVFERIEIKLDHDYSLIPTGETGDSIGEHCFDIKNAHLEKSSPDHKYRFIYLKK